MNELEAQVATLEEQTELLRQDNVRQWQAILRLAKLAATITGVPPEEIAAEEAFTDGQLRKIHGGP